MMKRLVVYDLDGTLLETAQLQMPVSSARWKRCSGAQLLLWGAEEVRSTTDQGNPFEIRKRFSAAAHQGPRGALRISSWARCVVLLDCGQRCAHPRSASGRSRDSPAPEVAVAIATGGLRRRRT